MSRPLKKRARDLQRVRAEVAEMAADTGFCPLGPKQNRNTFLSGNTIWRARPSTYRSVDQIFNPKADTDIRNLDLLWRV